jgi:hypothetical protein
MSHDSLLRNDEQTLAICRDWEDFSTKLFIAYQEQALKEIEYSEKPMKFSKLLRKFIKRDNQRKQVETVIQ